MIPDNENVCIVIATHNNAKTIKRAIDSVTKSIRPANQIVIGDNDSTDDTYNVLCKLIEAKPITVDGKTGLPSEFDGKFNDIPIKIFRKRFSTIGHTLNIAMQMKWQNVTIFGFLDPTSWYAPDKIIQSIRAFNINPAVACVVSDCDNHYLDGRVERIFRNSFDMQKLLAEFTYDRNFLVRTQVFHKLQSGFNEQMSIRDEYDLLLRIAKIGLIYHIPAPLHNNMVKKIDDTIQQSIEQCENTARQTAIQIWNQSGG